MNVSVEMAVGCFIGLWALALFTLSLLLRTREDLRIAKQVIQAMNSPNWSRLSRLSRPKLRVIDGDKSPEDTDPKGAA